VHLTSLDANSAFVTFVGIDYREVIGLGYRVFDPEVGDSSEYLAATSTTVTDIANSPHNVTHSMYKTDFFGLVEHLKCLFLGYAV
jgi:hypothetical protein